MEDDALKAALLQVEMTMAAAALEHARRMALDTSHTSPLSSASSSASSSGRTSPRTASSPPRSPDAILSSPYLLRYASQRASKSPPRAVVFRNASNPTLSPEATASRVSTAGGGPGGTALEMADLASERFRSVLGSSLDMGGTGGGLGNGLIGSFADMSRSADMTAGSGSQLASHSKRASRAASRSNSRASSPPAAARVLWSDDRTRKSSSEGREGRRRRRSVVEGAGSPALPDPVPVVFGPGGGRVGLRNLGNTCFLNAILQVLVHAEPVAQYFLSNTYLHDLHHYVGGSGSSPDGGGSGSGGGGGDDDGDGGDDDDDDGDENGLVVAFADVVRALWTDASLFAPVELKHEIGKIAPQFLGFQQQDSQEVLRFILDGLHESLNRVQGPKPYLEDPPETSGEAWAYFRSRDASAIVDMFGGMLESSLTCTSCGSVSRAFDPFLDLSLRVPGPADTDAVASFASHSHPHPHPHHPHSMGGGGMVLAYRDMYGNPVYRNSPTASMASIPAYEPPRARPKSRVGTTLQASLEAFTASEPLGADNKVMCETCGKPTEFCKQLKLDRLPTILVLHLKRFSLSTIDGKWSKVSTPVQFPSHRLDMSPYLSSASGGVVDAEYNLIGVVNHMGDTTGGHYTAASVHPGTGEWLLFDDSRVHGVDRSGISESKAYVLFYQRSR